MRGKEDYCNEPDHPNVLDQSRRSTKTRRHNLGSLIGNPLMMDMAVSERRVTVHGIYAGNLKTRSNLELERSSTTNNV